MATGGFTNPHNHPGGNSQSSVRDWNFSNSQRDVEQWNLMRLQMTNNLSQERDQHRDLPLHALNLNGNCLTNKNDTQHQREKVADKDESQHHDPPYALGSCIPKSSQPTRTGSLQRSKYKTPTSSFSLPAMNGVRQKNPSFSEQGSGDGSRSKPEQMHATNPKRPPVDDVKEMDARNIYHDASAVSEAKENIGKMSNNSNQVLAHLKQIRDTMQQMNTTIELLKMTGTPKAEKRILKLQKTLDELKVSEQQLVEFLNKVSRKSRTQSINFEKLLNDLQLQENAYVNCLHQCMAIHEDDMLIAENGDPDSFEGSVDEDNANQSLGQHGTTSDSVMISDDALVHKQRSDAISKQVELLCKVKECEDNLRMWQSRQAALSDLQQKTENRLAESKALHNQLEENEENGDISPTEAQQAAATLVQDDLDCLQERLNALREMSNLQEKNEESENVIERDRLELQNKLQDLQEKKKYMDSLMDELNAMRTLRSQQMLNNEAAPNDNFKERGAGGGSSGNAKSVLRSAQDLLVSLDTTDKFEKLKDMKHRIHDLQEMIANYAPNRSSKAESDADTMFKSHSQPAFLNHVASPLTEHSRKENMQRKTSGQKKVNISRDHSDEYLTHMSLEAGGATGNTDHHEQKQDDNVRMLIEGDPVFQEKLNKLKNARAKVSKLEQLLASLQGSQLPKDFNVADAQELLEEIDADSSRAQGYEPTDNVHSHEPIVPLDDQYETSSCQDEHSNKMVKRKNKTNRKFDDQRSEFENLLEEGNKLLAQHQQMSRLKTRLVDNNAENSLSLPSHLSARSSRLEMPVATGCKNRTQVDSVAKSNQQKSISKNVASNQLTCDKNTLMNKVPKLTAEDVQDLDLEFSNPEFWVEMRQQIILREELQQKRREVEELMRKDHGKTNTRNQDNMSDNISYSNKSDGVGMSFVGTEGTTAATWGGSTQENPEDQDDQNDTQEEVEEPDANEDVRNTWNNKPVPHSANQTWSSHQLQSSQSRIWNAGPEANEERREPDPSSVNVDRANVHWNQQAACLQQHWEQMNAIRQSIIRDEHNLHSLFQQQSNMNNVNPGPANCSPVADFLRPCVPDICQHYSQQLQQQHLLINLNQCYHMLCLQTLEIQQIQQQLQQVLRVCAPNLCSMEETHTPTPANFTRPMDSSQVHMVATAPAQSSCTNSHFSRSACESCPQMDQPVLPTRTFPSPLTTQQLAQPETLNNQVAPGIRTNNYWDNFRSYSRQNLLSTAPCNKVNGVMASSSLNNPHVVNNPHGATMTSSNQEGFPPPLPPQDTAPNTNAGNIGNVPMENPIPTLKLQHITMPPAQDAHLAMQVPKLELGNLLNTMKDKKARMNQEQKPGRQSFTDHPSVQIAAEITSSFKPGLSSGISGTAYLANTPSCSSSVVSLGSSSRENPYSRVSGNQDARMNKVGSGEPCDRSLFETLREPIYSEVAALISQNEEYPHFLIQLFSDLQMLNSDFLRRNALVAIHNLIVQLRLENTSMNAVKTKQSAFWGEANSHILSEPTASDSLMTSDDEEVRAHLFKINKPVIKPETNSSKRMMGQGDMPYEFSHGAQLDKNLADTSSSYGGVLGDDGSSDMAAVSAAKSKDVNQPRRKLASTVNPKLNQNMALSLPSQVSFENASGSRSEMNNEKSVSDIPLDGLNTAQLDDQIQGIMLEVIPFLKAHLDEPCSTNILTYVCHITLSLVAHLDDGIKLNHYFKKQLNTVLQETLSKYTGKRLRDCGEDLLVDLSESLFNELAFLRLVQNMDNNGLTSKSRHFHGLAQTSVSSTSNESSPKNIAGVSESRSKSKDAYILQSHGPMGESEATDIDTTMQRTDEDDLGQSRDDAMAARCDIFEVEDASRASSSASVRIASSLPEVADENRRTAHNQSLPNDESLPLPSAPLAPEEQDNMFAELDRETEADELEDNQDLAEADQSQIQLSMEASSPSHNVENQFDGISQCSEDLIRAEATEDDQAQRLMASANLQAAANSELMAASRESTEQGLDEIPIKLSISDEDVQLRRQEEELQNNLIDEILRDSVEAELVENGMPLRKPESQ